MLPRYIKYVFIYLEEDLKQFVCSKEKSANENTYLLGMGERSEVTSILKANGHSIYS